MTFAVALDLRAELGECPIWSVEEQALYFVDIKGRALHRFDPRAGKHNAIHPCPRRSAASGSGKAAVLSPAFARASGSSTPVASGSEKLADNPEDQTQSRFNDGRVDPAGRFLAGTIDEPKARRQGASLSLRRPRPLSVLAEGLLTSNGVAFSPDGRTLYHADTPTFTIWRYAYDPATGDATGRRACSRVFRRRKAIAAGLTARLSMRKGATGRRSSREAGFSATPRMDSFSPNIRFRPAAPRWSLSAAPISRPCM